MMIRIRIQHDIIYHYEASAMLSLQTIVLRPRSTKRHDVRDFSLTIEPTDAHISWVNDLYGNVIARCMVPTSTEIFRISAQSEVTPRDLSAFDFFLETSAMTHPFRYSDEEFNALSIFLQPLCPEVAEKYLASFLLSKGIATTELLNLLTQTLARDFTYVTRDEAGVQPPAMTIAAKSGSCRDLSWLLIALLRHLGIAGRFVSGYLLQPATDDLNGAGCARAGFHAWAEAYLPGAGWVGLDPTSGLWCADQHVEIAAFPHYLQAGPVQGRHSSGQAALTFRVSAETIDEGDQTRGPRGYEGSFT